MTKRLKDMSWLKQLIKELPFLVLYIALWSGYIFFMDVFTSEGFRIDYGIACGGVFKAIICVIGVLVFLSFAIIKMLCKKTPNWLRYVTAFVLSVVFFASTVCLDNYIYKRIEFSQDIWKEYPETRVYLFEKINDSYDIHTFSKKDVEELFGSPDEYDEDLFVYNDGNNNAVYVKFNGDLVVDMYSID